MKLNSKSLAALCLGLLLGLGITITPSLVERKPAEPKAAPLPSIMQERAMDKQTFATPREDFSRLIVVLFAALSTSLIIFLASKRRVQRNL